MFRRFFIGIRVQQRRRGVSVPHMLRNHPALQIRVVIGIQPRLRPVTVIIRAVLHAWELRRHRARRKAAVHGMLHGVPVQARGPARARVRVPVRERVLAPRDIIIIRIAADTVSMIKKTIPARVIAAPARIRLRVP